jgi:hypothetical protein
MSVSARVLDFLLGLGVGFAFLGRRARLPVEGRDCFADLLFYHLRLRRWVAVGFAPRGAALDAVLPALDGLARRPSDGASIGILLRRRSGRAEAEYVLPERPGVWRRTRELPPAWRGSLPRPEDLEEALRRNPR